MIAGGVTMPGGNPTTAVVGPGDSPRLLFNTLGPVFVTVWAPSTE